MPTAYQERSDIPSEVDKMMELSISTYWPIIEIESDLYDSLSELGYSPKKIYYMHDGERRRIAELGVRSKEKIHV